ncbi:hypothetical protein Ahy_B01g056254 isoform A [Arachis hypogaea]|uniref:Uncharacterized protein n=1 Tax=Arachis hypogaea TaxID=3818 RepID=A0A445AYG7_ARAHY|nr:hypothetical protein Ahy_B01g056254 isoform A [Arachis hypogaea]
MTVLLEQALRQAIPVYGIQDKILVEIVIGVCLLEDSLLYKGHGIEREFELGGHFCEYDKWREGVNKRDKKEVKGIRFGDA